MGFSRQQQVHMRPGIQQQASPSFIALFAILLTALGMNGCRLTGSNPKQCEPANAPDTFTIAFYNVENLFDYEYDGHEYPEYRPNATNWTEAMQELKVAHIAAVLSALNPTVAALCEVEDLDALNQLQARLKKNGTPYPFSAIADTPVQTTTCPALLSKLPIVNKRAFGVTTPNHAPTRNILEADITLGSTPCKLFVTHWPSKHQPESFRVAAAETLAARVRELNPTVDYILCGDLNSDYDEYQTFTTFDLNNTRGITGINHGLGTIYRTQANHTAFTTKQLATTPTTPRYHYDLWLDLPTTDRMSYFYRGNKQTPDHIILPGALFDSSGIAYVDKSFSVFTWNDSLLRKGKPYRWAMRYSGKHKYHRGEGYSDHLPIFAQFTVKHFTAAEPLTQPAESAAPKEDAAAGWFETETNGWVAWNNQVQITLDTIRPYAGRAALHCSAPAQKQNGTVARVVLSTEQVAQEEHPFTIHLRGSGSFCFRSRCGSEKWVYHNALTAKPSGSARYQPVTYASWKARTIELQQKKGAAEAVTLELRIGKSTPLDLWIDR